MPPSAPTRPLTHLRPTPLSKFHFGVCYYPEHCDAATWADDARRMKDAAINLARMAEFAWDRMEPEEGTYDFSFFEKPMALLAEQGVQTMLCTPTAAPPRWLSQNYPELLREDGQGRLMSHGSRQHLSNLHPEFDRHSRRITRAMAEHFRDHPHVVGWQTDNEFNCHFSEDHSVGAQKAFGQWCRRRFNDDIDQLNEAWGTCFWSVTFRSFDQITTPRPMAPTYLNPAQVLDYHRFLSDGAAAFQRSQVEILREVNPQWWITHNGVFDHIDYRGPFTEDLDFLSFDSYPMFWNDLALRPAKDACRLDRTRGWSGNFFVPEQQCGAGGQPPYMHDSPAPGEMRQFAWRSVARGADGLMFFRWRSCRFGAEQYWQGILDHDNVGRRRYDEASQLGHELRELEPLLLNTTVRADVAIAGPDAQVDAGFEACHFGLPRPYDVTQDVHRFFFERGLATGIIHPEDDLTQLKLYVIPHWAMFDTAWLPALQRWVEAGGTLVVGAMTATRDMHNNVVGQTAPGVLAALAGVTIADYTRVNEPRVRPMDLILDGHDTPIPGRHWIESLTPADDTQVLARWQNQWFDGQPAITQRPVGQGSVVYVGGWLTEELTTALLPRLVEQAGVQPLAADAPAGIEAVQRVGKDHCLTVLFNNAEAPAAVPLPQNAETLIGETSGKHALTMPPRGIAIYQTPRVPVQRSGPKARPASTPYAESYS